MKTVNSLWTHFTASFIFEIDLSYSTLNLRKRSMTIMISLKLYKGKDSRILNFWHYLSVLIFSLIFTTKTWWFAVFWLLLAFAYISTHRWRTGGTGGQGGNLPPPPILSFQLTLFYYAHHITTLPPPQIFRPSSSSGVYIGIWNLKKKLV